MNEKVVGTNQNKFTKRNCAELLKNHIDYAPLMIRCRIYENDSTGIENKNNINEMVMFRAQVKCIEQPKVF